MPDVNKVKAEIWKPVPGYEDSYQISSFGNVRSVSRFVFTHGGQRRGVNERFLSQHLSNGYLTVSLWKDNKEKHFLVHRLVALAHLSNPDNLPQVNHKDGNKLNNNVDNLEWVSASENIRHAVSTSLIPNRGNEFFCHMGELAGKVHATPVRCLETKEEFSSQKEAAAKLGVSVYAVCDSCKDGKAHSRYTFEKLHKPRKLFVAPQAAPSKSKLKHSCPVRCIETGEVFESRGKAARELNIPESSVYDSLRDGRSHCGYTFVNVDR